jgi:hypothetical protein
MDMTVRHALPGEVLYFYPEELTILVVMSNDIGIRYIEPANPIVDVIGNVKTKFISYDALSEWTISLGSITDISAALMGKNSK